MIENRLSILSSEKSWYFKQLEVAGAKAGIQVERMGFPSLAVSTRSNGGQNSNGKKKNPVHKGFSKPDCSNVLVRTMPLGSLEQVIFRMDVLRCWESSGIRVINSPFCLETSIDKLLSLQLFSQNSIPIPDTYACQTAEQAFEAFEVLGQDIVVKPIFGGEGRGIVRVTDHDMAHRVFQTLERMQSVIYCQRVIQNVGKDIRVLFVGDKHFSILRQNEHSWKSNASLGGQGSVYEPTETEFDLALAAKESVRGQLVGVDLLQDANGQYFVLEVNAVPGWKLLQQATGVDIAAEVIQFATNPSRS